MKFFLRSGSYSAFSGNETRTRNFRLVPASGSIISLALVLCTLLVLAGCASTDDQDDYKNWPPEKLYKSAKEQMRIKDYELAIQYFETLEARYPFGKLAEQAQLETAFAYYKFQEYDSAIAAADRFIKLHPSHENVDYAYYLRGLAAFHKKDTPMSGLFDEDPSERDPSAARDSFNYFAELVKKFPASKYVPDSLERMKFQRNALARHELNVANYYYKRGAFVACINRAKYVVENYQQTPSVPEALILLSDAYTQLKMLDLAADTRRILEMNFPNYKSAKSNIDNPNGTQTD